MHQTIADVAVAPRVAAFETLPPRRCGTHGSARRVTMQPVRRLAVVFVAALTPWLMSCDDDGCTDDGLLGPNGETYGRDPGKNCQFVDDDGNVIDDAP